MLVVLNFKTREYFYQIDKKLIWIAWTNDLKLHRFLGANI